MLDPKYIYSIQIRVLKTFSWCLFQMSLLNQVFKMDGGSVLNGLRDENYLRRSWNWVFASLFNSLLKSAVCTESICVFKSHSSYRTQHSKNKRNVRNFSSSIFQHIPICQLDGSNMLDRIRSNMLGPFNRLLVKELRVSKVLKNRKSRE